MNAKATKDHLVILEFSHDLQLPDDFVQDAASSKFVDLRVIWQTRYEDERTIKELIDWQIISSSPFQIKLRLVYEDPIEVSSSTLNDRDQLLVQVEMSEFMSKEGLRPPPSVVITCDIPRQISSLTEANTIETVGETGRWLTNTSGLIQFGLNSLLGLSLQALWGMLHVLQLIVHLPLNKGYNYPANAA